MEQFVKALDKGDDPSALTDPVYSGEVSDGAEILPTDRILSTGKRLKNAAGTVTTNFGAYGTDSCYAQMDLGRLCEIEKIHLVCGGDKTLYAFVNAVFKYEIQVSRDGETFETVFTKTDNEMEFENGYTVAVEKVQARYIRVIGLYYSKGTDFTISKMDVYGTAIGEPVNPDGGEKTNVASGKDAWIYTQESSKIGSYSLKTASGITNGVLTDNTWAYGHLRRILCPDRSGRKLHHQLGECGGLCTLQSRMERVCVHGRSGLQQGGRRRYTGTPGRGRDGEL